ncbi:hypothetical protein Hypma_002917 [Hypsizygus marmoreus]|uniref:Cytochrome P450 n=1 Tax=Hypsizygus marmoreus TaxID=39966 RepID=A0A369JAR7_HYPMA|nr:hypothetical protein Hypma_002917 [Hypsizygus marmoreus]
MIPLLVAFTLATMLIFLFRQWRYRSPYEHIPGPAPSSLFGYLLDLYNPEGLGWHFQMTEKFGHVARLKGGIVGSDALYITDPTALHSILVRDHNVFRNSIEFSGLFGIVHHGDGLASVYDDEHKKQRKLIDPIFTPNRISKLTPLFYNVARQMKASLAADLASAPPGQEIDILDVTVRTSLELIAQAGLGHTFNSFDRDSKEFKEFHWAITSVLLTASRLFLFLPYLETWRKMKPVWLRRSLARLVPYIPWSAPRKFQEASETMYPIYQTVLEDKKRLFRQGGMEALEESATSGKDLMTLLFKSNWEAQTDDKMPDDVVIANLSAVVHGAQETTSGALSRFVSLLASNPSLQDQLREELREARDVRHNSTTIRINSNTCACCSTKLKGSDELDFHELNDLPFLDAVCRETLRLFTPVTFVLKRAIEDTVVPLQYPIRDVKTGQEMHEILITKGTHVYVGLAAANRSAAIWGPDASVFRPERWFGKMGHESTAENTRLPGLYSNMMTFLGGPRACPGMRFAIHEIKLVLSTLLQSFAFEKASSDIDWKLYITLTPYVAGDDTGPKVPVKAYPL